jgi:arsenite transporter
VTSASDTAKRLNVFERYLSLWVALCIVAGIGLGRVAPALVQALSRLEVHPVTCRSPC